MYSSLAISAFSHVNTCPCFPVNQGRQRKLKYDRLDWNITKESSTILNRTITSTNHHTAPQFYSVFSMRFTFEKVIHRETYLVPALTSSVSVHIRSRSTSRLCRMLLMLSISWSTASAVLSSGKRRSLDGQSQTTKQLKQNTENTFNSSGSTAKREKKKTNITKLIVLTSFYN